MHKSPEILHKSPNLPWSISAAGIYRAPKGKDFPPHLHTGHEIIFYEEGHIQTGVGDQVYEVHPGMIVIIPPHTIHYETALTSYTNYCFVLHGPEHIRWPLHFYDDTDRTIGQLCYTIVREWNGHGVNRDALLQLQLQQLDLLLQRAWQNEQASPDEQIVAKAERILSTRFTTPLSISEVAAEINVSLSTLRAHFTRLRGLSPLAYLQQIRLHHALMLIRSSTMSFEGIARLCGYDSASHLSRYVKRAMGASPGKLRAQMQNAQEEGQEKE